ncbi:MAG: LPS export ABC transporter periplasmic protein LptC [Proteobacteria bacterium]|nr:LPS export ABC transporter periplasmic protein LptC [Pseudomonadota bacterium]
MRLPGRSLALVILAVVGIGSWWWLSEQREEIAIDDQPRHPDSYFRNLDVVRHGIDGKGEMRVNAEYAEHFENDAWVHLRAIDATGLADGPDWRLRANEGRLSDDGVQLEARGDVVLSRPGENTAGMQLRTDTLSVNTDAQIATTKDSVLITQGGSEISGRGMWASLADDYLRLESDVEAYYAK